MPASFGVCQLIRILFLGVCASVNLADKIVMRPIGARSPENSKRSVRSACR